MANESHTTDWNAIDPSSAPPFNGWPKWALDLDIEIADMAGDVVFNTDEEDRTPEGKAALAAYDRVRSTIARMVGASSVCRSRSPAEAPEGDEPVVLPFCDAFNRMTPEEYRAFEAKRQENRT